MKKILIIFFILFFASQAWGATYYVDQNAADDTGAGSEGDPWKNSPDMSTWTGGASVLGSGDTVYFDSADTWTASTYARLLTATEGVTYDGKTWGGGTRATFQPGGNQQINYVGAIGINVSDVTLRGIHLDGIDGSGYQFYGIAVGWNAASDFDTILIDDCEVAEVDTPSWGYGIVVSSATNTKATDLTCADGDAASPVVSSVTITFEAGDVGNDLMIIEAGTGFTPGLYTIASVNAGDATLDRACGANGALSGGDFSFRGITISDVTIKDSIVHDNGREGIALYQNWTNPGSKTDTVLVQNCTVYNNTQGILVCNYSHNVTIEDCTIYGNSSQGIWVRVSYAGFDAYYPVAPENLVIRRNWIYQNPTYGIAVFTASIETTAEIYNNFLYNNGYSGADGRAEILLYTVAGYNWGTSNISVLNNTIVSTVNESTNVAAGGVVVGFFGGSMSEGDVVIQNNVFYVGSGISGTYYRCIKDDEDDITTHTNNLFYRDAATSVDVVQINGTDYDRAGAGSDVTNWEATAQKTDPHLQALELYQIFKSAQMLSTMARICQALSQMIITRTHGLMVLSI